MPSSLHFQSLYLRDFIVLLFPLRVTTRMREREMCSRFCIKNKRQRVTRSRTENKSLATGRGRGKGKVAARVHLIEFLAVHSIKSIFVSVRVHRPFAKINGKGILFNDIKIHVTSLLFAVTKKRERRGAISLEHRNF